MFYVTFTTSSLCFFKEIDNLIELENRKVKLYKNTLNSYVNSKSLEFYKKHECIRLRNVINISNTRNKHQDKIVHTISGEKGIIHQSQVYQRSISSSDTSKYKVIKKDMFVYNKSFSKEYPCGTIKRMKNSEGCVSPLYIPFEVTDNNLLDFFEHFFESKIWQNELSKTIGKSARNQLSINDDQFKNLMVPKIDNNEISKFKQFTTTLNDLILLSEDKVKLLEKKKTYYLNKIFH